MNQRIVLAVDVDLTVVDTLTPWLQWFRDMTDIDFKPKPDDGYDLVPMMMKAFKTRYGITSTPLYAMSVVSGFNPFDFWKQPNLYDEFVPIAGSVEAITMAREKYSANIVFVSHCVPEHEDSKYRFLKKYFPEHAFVSTADKGYVNCDILIDDSAHVLRRARSVQRQDTTNLHFTQINKFNNKEDCDMFPHKLESWDADITGYLDMAHMGLDLSF